MKKTQKLPPKRKKAQAKKPPPTPKPSKTIAPTTPEALAKGVKRKAKGANRPPTPTSFTWEEGSTILSSWDDEGMRVAGAIVGGSRYIWSEEQERWLEQVELVQYPALSTRMHVTLLGTHGRWMGPRETAYELREPTPLEMMSIREVIRKESLFRAQPKAESKPRTAKSAPASKPEDNRVVHLLKTPNPYKGKRAEMHAVLREGMTMADYLEALRNKGLRPERWTLEQDVEKGLVKLEAKKG